MVSTLTILFASIVCLLLVWAALRSGAAQIHSLDDWEAKRHEVDLEAFRLLLDPIEEGYLRSSLPPGEFRRFQRKRLGLALHALGLVGENAVMLMKLGQLARTGADVDLSRQAAELINGALRLRVNLLFCQPYLTLKWVFPGWAKPVPALTLPYEELLTQLLRFRQERQWDFDRIATTG